MLRESIKNDSENSLDDDENEQPQNHKQESRLNNIVQASLFKKQYLGVSFSGIIRSGTFKNDNTLSIQYSFHQGDSWFLAGGQPSGISLKCESSQEKIVWNFPFGVTYQTKNIAGWPQIVVVVYGTDYFGRSIPRGYGNTSLPITEGTHVRKIRIFRPIQPTSWWSCINWMTSSQLEIKQAQKSLGNGEERKFLKVEYSGEIEIEVDTKPFNLDKHGYR